MRLPGQITFLVSASVLFFSMAACSQERRFTTPNSSMEPTVLQGEKLAVDSSAFHTTAPLRGDVIIFRHNGLLLLKRVIAVPGDVIEGKNFEVRLNGTLLKEDFIEHVRKNSIPESDFLRSFPKIVVPGGHFFVMGDNRDVSDDSRDPNFGLISLQDVIGKAVRIVKSSDPNREGAMIR